jgi:hypothetical protein
LNQQSYNLDISFQNALQEIDYLKNMAQEAQYLSQNKPEEVSVLRESIHQQE